MTLTVLAIGKLREPHFRAAAEEYLQRIRRFLPVEHFELPVAQGHDAVTREAAAIERSWPREGRVVALDVKGRQLSSDQLRDWIENIMTTAVPRVTFVIGGASGLADRVLERADIRLSLSAMTLPHELARVVLLEQLYRALTMWKGLPYHK